MKQIKSILLYLEDLDSATLNHAVDIAESASAKLTLGVVVKPARSRGLFGRSNFDLDEVEGLLVQDRQRRLTELANSVSHESFEVATRVLVGDPTDAIIHAVQTEGFDFVAKTPTPTKGLRRHFFGGVDMRLMRACPCPVLIGRAKPGSFTRRVVVAVHDDEGNDVKASLNTEILDSVSFVLGKKVAAESEVHIVHAWSLYGETLLASGRKKLPPERFQAALDHEQTRRREWLDAMVEDYRTTLSDDDAAAFSPTLWLLHGDPQEVVPQKVKELDADILGMGTVSRGGMSGLLIGNTAEAILNRVNCSVITLKPSGFVSSVSAT